MIADMSLWSSRGGGTCASVGNAVSNFVSKGGSTLDILELPFKNSYKLVASMYIQWNRDAKVFVRDCNA